MDPFETCMGAGMAVADPVMHKKMGPGVEQLLVEDDAAVRRKRAPMSSNERKSDVLIGLPSVVTWWRHHTPLEHTFDKDQVEARVAPIRGPPALTVTSGTGRAEGCAATPPGEVSNEVWPRCGGVL